jgi:lactobin A/cerein 7B family class IIb bacteriocin
MRELQNHEISEVTGGPGPLVWVAIVVVGAIIGDAATNAIDGFSDGVTGRDNATETPEPCGC